MADQEALAQAIQTLNASVMSDEIKFSKEHHPESIKFWQTIKPDDITVFCGTKNNNKYVWSIAYAMYERLGTCFPKKPIMPQMAPK